MKINFIIDSGSDITRDEAYKWGITVLPLKIRFGDEEFADGVDITTQDFYGKLIETDIFPTTSQVAPYEYEEEFKKIKERGEVAIVITISSKLSGCYQSANIAAEDYDNIYIVDSLNAAIGERILMELALHERSMGKTAEEIVATLEEKKKDIRVVAKLETLEYLKKGGRLSAAAAGVGTLLSIKPVAGVVDGAVAVLGTARGSKNADNKLRETIKASGGIDFEMPHALAYSGLSDSDLQKYTRDSEDLFKERVSSIPYYQLGSVIGAHVGPGAVVAAFFAKEK